MDIVSKALEVGQFNRWAVISKARKQRYLVCKCDCGKEKEIRVDSLFSGGSKSCGCYAKEVFTKRMSTRGGISRHRLYPTWHDAQRRCFDPRRNDYHHYGGRGISMCNRWNDYEKGFYNFLEDMEGSWREGLELERLDTDGDYEPSNCTWVTRKQQTNNLRRNLTLTYEDYTLTSAEWTSLLNLGKKMLSDRVGELSWSEEKALCYKTKPLYHYKRKGTVYPNLRCLCDALCIEGKNYTNAINKLGGKEALFRKYDVEVLVIKEQRSLDEVLTFLTDQDYNPNWADEFMVSVKNKYKYYLNKENTK